jgi:hypothetical protein
MTARRLPLAAAFCALTTALGAAGVHAADTVTPDPGVAAAATARPEAIAHNDAPRALDRLQLDSTAITGNRELPKVMSIVPWKPAEPPAGPDRPMGSLIEEMLSPVDRDEFQREITYYRELTSQSSAVAGGVAPAPQNERPQSPSARSPGASLP